MEDRPAIGITVGKGVLRALGISPHMVQNIELRIGAEDLVRVEITRLVTEGDMGRIIEALDSRTFREVQRGE